MQIILLERVEHLGAMGEIVKVKDGYARNFLIPRGKALRATKRALDDFERRRAQLEADNAARRQEAEAKGQTMEGASLVVIRQASEAGQLYGSVSARDVAEGLAGLGFEVDRGAVRLAEPIKALGLYDVRLALHPEVDVFVKVNVARSVEEAEIQARGDNPDLLRAEEERAELEEQRAEAEAARLEAQEEMEMDVER